MCFLLVFSCWTNLAWPTEDSGETEPQKAEASKKGKIKRGTEAEGTQAPNRFDNSDFTTKSRYKLDNGEALEVDTD